MLKSNYLLGQYDHWMAGSLQPFKHAALKQVFVGNSRDDSSRKLLRITNLLKLIPTLVIPSILNKDETNTHQLLTMMHLVPLDFRS